MWYLKITFSSTRDHTSKPCSLLIIHSKSTASKFLLLQYLTFLTYFTRFYINYSPKHFQVILDFLRNDNIEFDGNHDELRKYFQFFCLPDQFPPVSNVLKLKYEMCTDPRYITPPEPAPQPELNPELNPEIKEIKEVPPPAPPVVAAPEPALYA